MARLMIFSRRPRARMRSEQAEWNIMIEWAVWICATFACLIATIGTGGIEAWEHLSDPTCKNEGTGTAQWVNMTRRSHRMNPDFTCWGGDGKHLGEHRVILFLVFERVAAGIKFCIYSYFPGVPKEVTEDLKHDRKIWLERWQEQNRPKAPQKLHDEVLAAFNHADKNGDGASFSYHIFHRLQLYCDRYFI